MLFYIEKILVADLKFTDFHFLVCKRLYNALTKESVLNARVKLADKIPLSFERGAHFFVYGTAHNSHNRHERKNHNRERKIYARQNYKRHGDFYRRDEKFFGTVMRKLGDVEKVAGYAPHNLTDFCIVEIRFRKLLQMRIRARTHIRFDFRAHNVTRVRHIIVCKSVDNSQNKIQKRQRQHHSHGKKRDVLNRSVGDFSDYHRKNDFAHRC